MSYHQYLANCTASSDDVLDDWRWLVGQRLQLWHVTRCGDALLVDPQDRSIHFLDTVNGKLERIAADAAEFESTASDREASENWLMYEIVDGMSARGMVPGENQCLSFKVPPKLGGKYDPQNMELCNIPVHFSIAGQIHRQVKDLPPGTKINQIKIAPPSSSASASQPVTPSPPAFSSQREHSSLPASSPKRPWWRFW